MGTQEVVLPRIETAAVASRGGSPPPRLAGGSRLALAVVALLFVPAFLWPIWRYDFEAPQYPEGLYMTIEAGGIGGQVDLVNGLNHYIGMRTISIEVFPELRALPWVLGGLAVFAGLVVLAGRRRLLAAWVATALGLAVAGLADFYRWLIVYGGTLDPEAPIQMDPFTPPLLGAKEVMNFRVVAYPDTGGLAVIAATLLAAAVLLIEWRRGRKA